MSKEKFENWLAENIINNSSVLFSLDNLSIPKEFSTSRRTFERWLASIKWLETSDNQKDQVDAKNNKSITTVFNHLVKKARKARETTLFAKIHDIPTNEKSIKHKVLVCQDGRKTKRWCKLNGLDKTSILKGLKIMASGKSVQIFPSGDLVAIFRSLNLKDEDLKEVKINLGHFQETLGKEKKIKGKIKKDNTYGMSHLDRLEAESIFVLREVMGHAENPVMLYSVGKDSSVMLHLAKKAFFPSPPPFPLMHVDTRWKFKLMYEFRDKAARDSKMELLVHINPEGIEKNINPFDHGSSVHTDIMKTQGLKQALDKYGFDIAFGGARRDEEKSRAKERIFSFRTKSHSWDPKNQRPELWNLYNCRKNKGESIRVFPLSNWTEMDIWQYIYREGIPIVPLYFSEERPVIQRNGMLILVDDDRLLLNKNEEIKFRKVRFRTLGCYPLTGAVESSASNLQEIMSELMKAKTSEREGRVIDTDSTSSMEIKKKEGYF